MQERCSEVKTSAFCRNGSKQSDSARIARHVALLATSTPEDGIRRRLQMNRTPSNSMDLESQFL